MSVTGPATTLAVSREEVPPLNQLLYSQYLSDSKPTPEDSKDTKGRTKTSVFWKENRGTHPSAMMESGSEDYLAKESNLW